MSYENCDLRVIRWHELFVPWPPGNTKTVTVDASKSQTVLPNLTPGVTYDVSVIAVKGQRESEAASESVTTGKLPCMWQWNNIHTRAEHLPSQLLPCFIQCQKISHGRFLRGNTDKAAWNESSTSLKRVVPHLGKKLPFAYLDISHSSGTFS